MKFVILEEIDYLQNKWSNLIDKKIYSLKWEKKIQKKWKLENPLTSRQFSIWRVECCMFIWNEVVQPESINLKL
jgi:uncharacterized protein YbdZ (MbtH family)